MESDQKPQTLYRCKRCRRIVASQDNVVPHKQGKGQSCFKWNKRSDTSQPDEKPECSSIFVEPLKWMQAVEEGHVEEKLWCPGCKARLGSFNWAGMQCSCGAWINPAFQLHKSRIDEDMLSHGSALSTSLQTIQPMEKGLNMVPALESVQKGDQVFDDNILMMDDPSNILSPASSGSSDGVIGAMKRIVQTPAKLPECTSTMVDDTVLPYTELEVVQQNDVAPTPVDESFHGVELHPVVPVARERVEEPSLLVDTADPIVEPGVAEKTDQSNAPTLAIEAIELDGSDVGVIHQETGSELASGALIAANNSGNTLSDNGLSKPLHPQRTHAAQMQGGIHRPIERVARNMMATYLEVFQMKAEFPTVKEFSDSSKVISQALVTLGVSSSIWEGLSYEILQHLKQMESIQLRIQSSSEHDSYINQKEVLLQDLNILKSTLDDRKRVCSAVRQCLMDEMKHVEEELIRFTEVKHLLALKIQEKDDDLVGIETEEKETCELLQKSQDEYVSLKASRESIQAANRKAVAGLEEQQLTLQTVIQGFLMNHP